MLRNGPDDQGGHHGELHQLHLPQLPWAAALRPPGAPRRTADRRRDLRALCFTCSKDLRVARQLTRALTAQGFAVLSFDFTGLGSSDGDFAEPTFTADVDDLRAAVDYVATVITDCAHRYLDDTPVIPHPDRYRDVGGSAMNTSGLLGA